MRLFIALHFSPEIKNLLLDTIDDLRDQADRGNFTRPENLHLTLAFIGETTNTAAVKRAMDRWKFKPFELTVGGSGRFGELHWAGVEKNPTLFNLAEGLKEDLRKEGFLIEKRPFKPHITLGRQIESREPIRLNVPKTSMTVSAMSLMRSDRINGKLTYTEIYRV